MAKFNAVIDCINLTHQNQTTIITKLTVTAMASAPTNSQVPASNFSKPPHNHTLPAIAPSKPQNFLTSPKPPDLKILPNTYNPDIHHPAYPTQKNTAANGQISIQLVLPAMQLQHKIL